MTSPPLDLAAHVRAGDLVLWGQGCARPLTLTRALADAAGSIGPIRCFAGLGIDDPDDVPGIEARDDVTVVSYTGIGHRGAEAAGRLSVVVDHYSSIAADISARRLVVDVLLVQVTRPGPDGRHRLAIAVDYVEAALQVARVVIAEVNDQAPLVLDAPPVDPARVTAWTRASYPPLSATGSPQGAVELAIAEHVASLIDDGATLQMGLGKIPEAVLARVGDRKDLGIHSGTIGDAVGRLIEAGAVTNRRKGRDVGTTVTGMLMGTPWLMDLAQREPTIALRPVSYTHDPEVLASLHHLVTVNSALEIDLGGQANCEVAAGRYVGALGGALDFLRGAQRAHRGVPVIALPSTAGGRSRIVDRLSGPVTIPREDAVVVVTEHGVADLRGADPQQRRERLLAVADPAHVAELE